MDSGTLAIIATAVGGLIGFGTATLTSWMNLRQARLRPPEVGEPQVLSPAVSIWPQLCES
jgi:hypothetical protein